MELKKVHYKMLLHMVNIVTQLVLEAVNTWNYLGPIFKASSTIAHHDIMMIEMIEILSSKRKQTLSR